MDYQRQFLESLPLLDEIVGFIARRHRLPSDQAEDLASGVKLKILEDDYAVLRKFEGRCSLKTFLTTVALRFFLDARDAEWGKWRPCALARRLGPDAVLLDRLITRDGLRVDEAIEVLRANDSVTLSSAELRALSAQLPIRSRHRLVGDEEIADLPDPFTSEAKTINSLDHRDSAEAVENALAAALAELCDQDRLILRMHFIDGFAVARISRLLGLEQKPLYRRLEHVMKVLRRHMESQGVAREHVLALLDDPGRGLGGLFKDSLPESAARRPSLS